MSDMKLAQQRQIGSSVGTDWPNLIVAGERFHDIVIETKPTRSAAAQGTLHG